MHKNQKCRRCKEKKPRYEFRYVSYRSWDYALCPTCLPIVEKTREDREKSAANRMLPLYPTIHLQSNFSHYWMLDGYLGEKYGYSPFVVLISTHRYLNRKIVERAVKGLDLLDFNLSALSRDEKQEIENDVYILDGATDEITVNVGLREVFDLMKKDVKKVVH